MTSSCQPIAKSTPPFRVPTSSEHLPGQLEHDFDADSIHARGPRVHAPLLRAGPALENAFLNSSKSRADGASERRPRRHAEAATRSESASCIRGTRDSGLHPIAAATAEKRSTRCASGIGPGTTWVSKYSPSGAPYHA